MNKGFCENCNELIEYTTKEIRDSIEIKGKKYEYEKTVAYCTKCGEEVSVNEFTDQNLEKADEVYRKQENIIQTDEIKQILTKYKI